MDTRGERRWFVPTGRGSERTLESDEIEAGLPTLATSGNRPRGSRSRVVARLRIGVLVLTCAEVFSGASPHLGLWHRWTLVVTGKLFGHVRRLIDGMVLDAFSRRYFLSRRERPP